MNTYFCSGCNQDIESAENLHGKVHLGCIDLGYWVEEPRQTKREFVSYEIHHLNRNGDVEWGNHYAPENWSQYYKANCYENGYNLAHATEHKRELEALHPKQTFIIVQVTTTYEPQ